MIGEIRHHLAQVRRERRFDLQGRWLRRVGYVARPAVYLGPMVVLVWWLWPYAIDLSQSTANVTRFDILLMLGCIMGFLGVAIPGTLLLLNIDGNDINWIAWGKIGLGLVAVSAAAVLLFLLSSSVTLL